MVPIRLSRWRQCLLSEAQSWTISTDIRPPRRIVQECRGYCPNEAGIPLPILASVDVSRSCPERRRNWRLPSGQLFQPTIDPRGKLR